MLMKTLQLLMPPTRALPLDPTGGLLCPWTPLGDLHPLDPMLCPPNHGDRSTPMHIAHRIMYAGAVHFAFCNYKAGCCCVGCTESDCDCDLLAVKQ